MRESEDSRPRTAKGPRVAGDFLSAIAAFGMFATYSLNLFVCGWLVLMVAVRADLEEILRGIVVFLVITFVTLFFRVMDYFGELMAGKAHFQEGDSPRVGFFLNPLWEVLLVQGATLVLCGVGGSFFLGFWDCLPGSFAGLGALVVSHLVRKGTRMLEQPVS